MPASRPNRASRQHEPDEALKRPAPGSDLSPGEVEAGEQPGLPDLSGMPVAPEDWLSLQQSIGNSAVGGLVERRRAGQSLPAGVRHDMEAAFSRNFGEVQIHSGTEVDQAAQSFQAGAFTVGNDIYVHSDLPGFEEPFGREVLGEELAHVAQGAGREAATRVTTPEETLERQAQGAGRAAAEGEPVQVRSAPEAAGAVARFGLEDLKRIYESVAGGETAARVERTELSDEEKDRLKSGALEPLHAMYSILQGKLANGAGKVDPKTLQPIADNTAGLSNFVMSFNAPTFVQPTLEAAAMGVANGRNALLAAIDPAQSIKDVAEGMASTAAELDGMATPAHAPAPAPDAQPGAAPADGLTQADADQLKSGAVQPLQSVAEQLKAEAPDLSIIVARLQSVPALLRSFSKPAALVPQMRRKAMSIEVQAKLLQAVLDGANGAITDATTEWSNALAILSGLTAKSEGGGAGGEPANAGASASGDDDDKKKPN